MCQVSHGHLLNNRGSHRLLDFNQADLYILFDPKLSFKTTSHKNGYMYLHAEGSSQF